MSPVLGGGISPVSSRPNLATSRTGSYSNMFWGGEQGPTSIVDNNLTAHLKRQNSADSTQKSYETYGAADLEWRKTIRFQVVVWSVGPPDTISGRVQMKFRVTIFWNDMRPVEEHRESDGGGVGTQFIMKGRQKAVERKITSEEAVRTIDVPQVSILNVQNFEVIGPPEVTLLRPSSRLLRWTCLYRATLLQDDFQVEKFPHDEHELCLKLGVLAQRQAGGRFDRSKWALALATEADSQRSIRIPHGLLVDHVKVPGFTYDSNRGLDFQLTPLSFGPKSLNVTEQDHCLEVKLRVRRDSGYYDRNIMPLLCSINLVAISILCLDASNFFQRGLMMLNIAFVQMGMRMTLDSRLPSVGYQIKMQVILNRFFYSLMFMVMESSFLYSLHSRGVAISHIRIIDLTVGIVLILNTGYLSYIYYKDVNPKMSK